MGQIVTTTNIWFSARCVLWSPPS